MNKREALYQRITAHGETLKTVFALDAGLDPVQLCKALRRLETLAHRLTTDYCNGKTFELAYEQETAKILARVDKLTNYKAQGLPVFVNGDPRGYALKLDMDTMKTVKLHRDMGGYGILAPDLND